MPSSAHGVAAKLTAQLCQTVAALGVGFGLGCEWQRQRQVDAVVLHITGPAVRQTNRGGGADRFADALLHYHDAQFQRAATFTLRDLRELENRNVEFKNPARWPEPHTFTGPLLTHVLESCDAMGGDEIVVTGLDGYASTLSMADVEKHSMLLAHSMDNRCIPIGGRGPLYLMFQDAAQKDMGISRTVWGVFHIHVS
jgi:hypothetical protein